MKSNFNELFYTDINQAITSWESLLTCLQGDLNFKKDIKADKTEVLAEVKQATFDAYKSKNVAEVQGVSELYAKNIAEKMTQLLAELYPNLDADIEFDEKQKAFLKITYSHYSKGVFSHNYSQRLDTFNDFMKMIDVITNHAEYYGILDEVQDHEFFSAELDKVEDNQDSFLMKLSNSTVEDIIEQYNPTEEEFEDILATSSFYEAFGEGSKDCPPEVVRAIATALAVKAMLQEQLDLLDATDVELSIEFNGLQVDLVARKKGDDEFEIYVLDIEDIGNIINQAK